MARRIKRLHKLKSKESTKKTLNRLKKNNEVIKKYR